MTDRPDRVPTGTSYDRQSDTRWAHRNLGGLWWLALLLVPLLLAALLTAVRGGAIGDDLRDRALGELKAAGFAGVDIDASGRDLTLTAADGSALSAADADKARDLVAGIDGVRVATLADGVGDGSGDSGDSSATPSEEPSETATETPSESTTDAAGAPECEASAAQASIDLTLGDDFIQFGELRRVPDEVSKAEIVALAQRLSPCTDLAVTVTGYTDKLGSKKLSLARAINVANALTEGGVTADIRKVGGHFSRALGDNETRAGRDMNRFATITVK